MGVLQRVVGVSAVGLAVATMLAVPADAAPAQDAVEFCKMLAEEGVLKDEGVTFGECVTILKGPSSENSNNVIAGACGIDGIVADFGASNKGQCIKLLKGTDFI